MSLLKAKEEEEGKMEEASPEVADGATAAELTVPLDEDGCLSFYWFDAYEEPTKPGRIYLFGKVKTGEKVGVVLERKSTVAAPRLDAHRPRVCGPWRVLCSGVNR